jgi:exonuclease VII small subunit
MEKSNNGNMQKEALGFLPLMGIGAAAGLLAYGLEKSFGLLTGGKSLKEFAVGFNADKKKVQDFENDLNSLKKIAPKLMTINDALAESIPAYIKACEQVLPQMKSQIAQAESELLKREQLERSSPGNNEGADQPSPELGKPVNAAMEKK